MPVRKNNKADVPKKKTYEDMNRELWAECKRLAELSFEKYVRNTYDRLYVVGVPKEVPGCNTPVWYDLSLESESEESERTVISHDLVPRNMTVEQIMYWMHERLKNVSMFCFVD